MQLTAVLIPAPEGGFVATNPETGTTSQGETVDEAMTNLREATELYLEEFALTPRRRSEPDGHAPPRLARSPKPHHRGFAHPTR